jgi:hypothetical protein
MPSRALVASLVLVGACVLGQACGGSVAPGVGGDGGGSSGGGSSGGSGSGGSSGGVGDGGNPADTAAPLDSPLTGDTSAGPCQVDGVPCITAGQCCSSVCGSGLCGGPAPTCTADGVPCQSSSQCCSGLCSGSICEEPAACAVSSNANQCDVCLAQSCCPQLTACDSNTACTQSQACFDGCYEPGMGVTCGQKCVSQFPSTQGDLLEQCAANACLTSCQ